MWATPLFPPDNSAVCPLHRPPGPHGPRVHADDIGALSDPHHLPPLVGVEAPCPRPQPATTAPSSPQLSSRQGLGGKWKEKLANTGSCCKYFTGSHNHTLITVSYLITLSLLILHFNVMFIACNWNNLRLKACCSAQMPPPPRMHKPNATIILKILVNSKKWLRNLKKAFH